MTGLARPGPWPGPGGQVGAAGQPAVPHRVQVRADGAGHLCVARRAIWRWSGPGDQGDELPFRALSVPGAVPPAAAPGAVASGRTPGARRGSSPRRAVRPLLPWPGRGLPDRSQRLLPHARSGDVATAALLPGRARPGQPTPSRLRRSADRGDSDAQKNSRWSRHPEVACHSAIWSPSRRRAAACWKWPPAHRGRPSPQHVGGSAGHGIRHWASAAAPAVPAPPGPGPRSAPNHEALPAWAIEPGTLVMTCCAG